jgi:hypothetical protein
MAFGYHNSGDDVILDVMSTAWYVSDAASRAEVQAFAQRNVDETGRPCDVFAADGVTLLYRARPTQPTKPGVG